MKNWLSIVHYIIKRRPQQHYEIYIAYDQGMQLSKIEVPLHINQKPHILHFFLVNKTTHFAFVLSSGPIIKAKQLLNPKKTSLKGNKE